MTDDIRRIDYYYAIVPAQPGAVARILSAFHLGKVRLLGVSSFPYRARQTQVDFIPEDDRSFLELAEKLDLKLSKKKSGFLMQGADRPGAIAGIVNRLANLHVTAFQAISAGAGRYAGILWVKNSDLAEATRRLSSQEPDISEMNRIVDEASEESFPASDSPAY